MCVKCTLFSAVLKWKMALRDEHFQINVTESSKVHLLALPQLHYCGNLLLRCETLIHYETLILKLSSRWKLTYTHHGHEYLDQTECSVIFFYPFIFWGRMFVQDSALIEQIT